MPLLLSDRAPKTSTELHLGSPELIVRHGLFGFPLAETIFSTATGWVAAKAFRDVWPCW